MGAERHSKKTGVLNRLSKPFHNVIELPAYFRYTDALATNWERRKACNSKWNFKCQCKRCNDPTEFETYTSGIICSHCTHGILLIDSEDTKVPRYFIEPEIS